MRKLLVTLLAFSLLYFSTIAIHQPSDIIIHGQESPPYAKWGKIAMQNVKQKYPNADIVDYLHVGRKTGVQNSTETFKLWLRAPDKEFGVFVNITFDNESEEIVDITYKEVDR